MGLLATIKSGVSEGNVFLTNVHLLSMVSSF